MKYIFRLMLAAVTAMVLSVATTSCGRSDTDVVGDPYFQIEGDVTGLDIDCLGNTDAAPGKFVVRSNRPWKIVARESYDWVHLYPVDGGKGDGMFRIVVDQNESTVDRVAYFTINVNGEDQPTYFTVTQQKDSPRVRGEVESVSLDKSAGEYSFSVLSNVDWKVAEVTGNKDSEGNEWFTLGTSDNESGTVNYSVKENATYETRTAVVSIVAVSDALINAEVSISQAGIGAELDGLFVDWLMSADVMAAYTESFQVGGRIAATTGIAFLDYVRGEESVKADTNGKFALTVGATGQPYVTGSWQGDSWQFSVPSVDIPAGTIISVRYVTRSSAAGHKYWIMELFDGDAWVPIGEVQSATDSKGNAFDYSIDLAGADDYRQIDLKATYQKNTKNGKIMVRQRCVGDMTAAGNVIAAPGGGTNRIAGDAENRPSISVLYVGNGTVGPVEEATFKFENLEDNTVLFDGEPAEPYTFSMSSSMGWVLSSDADWFSFTPDRGAAGEMTAITVTAQNNESKLIRKGVIKITAGTTEKSIVVVQAPRPGAGDLDPFIAVSSANNLIVAAAGETVTVNVTNNVEYSVVIDDSSNWISEVVAPQTRAEILVDSRMFHIDANKSGGERNGQIKFVNVENNVEAVVNVRQLYSATVVYYYETVGEVSKTTALAAIPWNKSGEGASTVSYSGGAKIDARTTCNQGSVTTVAYNTYTNALMDDANCSPNGNVYFGNDTSAELTDSWFRISDISFTDAEALQFGMGMYRDVAQTAEVVEAKPLIVSYKFDTDSDWTVLDNLTGAVNWNWYSLPAFKVPSGATKVSINMQATIKQTFRVDDFTLVKAKVENVPAAPLPATWLFTEDYFKSGKYTDAFVVDNALPVESGQGTLSYYSVVEAGLQADPDAKAARLIGSTGHPYITGGWTGDYWLFTVPANNIVSGSTVNIKFITRTSKTGHKFWMLECLDGGEWKPVGDVLTESETGTSAQYTHAMANDGKTNVQVDANYTYTANAYSGIKFRFRCMANWQAGGSGALEVPNGGTSRIAGDATGTSPVISLVK